MKIELMEAVPEKNGIRIYERVRHKDMRTICFARPRNLLDTRARNLNICLLRTAKDTRHHMPFLPRRDAVQRELYQCAIVL